MQIRHIVIHELVKKQHEEIQPSNIRPEVLDFENEIVEKLVIEISKLYGKRRNTAHYGIFKTNEGRGLFPDPLEDYSNLEAPTVQQFLELSRIGMDSLFTQAQNIMASSGGYILFADYSNAQGNFFLVAMIKSKDGITLSNELKPEELTQLDLSRLYQAARINFDKLNNFMAAGIAERQEINYLSFISPSSSQAAANYFITAFGCARGTASAQATNNLIKESVTFFRNKEELRNKRFEFRTALTQYLYQKLENGESIKLSEIEELARPFMPADEEGHVDELADELITLLNSEELAIPNEFPPNKNVIIKNTHITHKEENWEIKFDRVALGDTEDAQIFFDEENNKITINAIPNRMVSVLKEELEMRHNNG